MRLSYAQIRLRSYKDVDPNYLKYFKDIGFQVLGFPCDLNATDDDIKRLKDIFGEMELEVGQVTPGRRTGLLLSDPGEMKEAMKNAAKALEIGGKLGATSLQFSSGSLNPNEWGEWKFHMDNNKQESFDKVVANAKELAPIAEDCGCMITPETNHWTIINSIEKMKEFVDRVDSPFVKIVFDPVNHIDTENIYDTGRFIKCAVEILGDRIGNFHVKDGNVQKGDPINVCHINEVKMGTGILHHEAIIEVSTKLEPWKPFILEHIRDENDIKPAHDYIQSVAARIGHKWTDPSCTRERWKKGLCK